MGLFCFLERYLVFLDESFLNDFYIFLYTNNHYYLKMNSTIIQKVLLPVAPYFNRYINQPKRDDTTSITRNLMNEFDDAVRIEILPQLNYIENAIPTEDVITFSPQLTNITVIPTEECVKINIEDINILLSPDNPWAFFEI